ncbi:hypothetical protein CTEN210_10782 [Chaetoceros tenuissimus]|uniref:Kinesin light chain n=1 Tax=Chaetoceros tenuissimus TaxID=426638 RepID=A0AAD3D026_9STRA|nr:hypothetical protein CTEN210_10782 [Chaetoceros tenuissimus]
MVLFCCVQKKEVDGRRNGAVEDTDQETGAQPMDDKNKFSPEELGVSVFFLENTLQAEIRDSSKPNANLDTIEESVLKKKGSQTLCPRDGNLGASYVDCLDGPENVGKANLILSFDERSDIQGVLQALVRYCEDHNLEKKETYVWTSCLCENLWRSRGMTSKDQLRDEIGKKIRKADRHLYVISPWNNPLLLERSEFLYELYLAFKSNRNIALTMATAEEDKLVKAMKSDDPGSYKSLVDVILHTTIQGSKAFTEEETKIMMDVVDEDIDASVLNVYITSILRKLIVNYLDDLIQLYTIHSKDPRRDLDLADLLFGIGNFINDIEDQDKAVDILLRCKDIREEVLGAKHRLIPRTRNSIGMAYDSAGKFNEAIEMYKTSKELNENAKREFTTEQASVYTSLGFVYDKQHEYDEAIKMYRKALHISEKVNGSDHTETADAYNNIGTMYCNQGEYQNAVEMFEKALAIRENVLGSEHLITGDTYNNLAFVYLDDEKYDDAISMYEKALIVYERVHGTNHSITASIYFRIADAFDEKGDTEKALEYFGKSRDSYEACLGKGHWKVLDAMAKIKSLSKK